MRGHIVKRGKASWRIQVYGGKGPDGKPRRYFETVKSPRKGDAQKRLTELLGSLDKGVYTPPGHVTVADYLRKWLKDYVWPNLSPRTAEGYEHMCSHHFVPLLGNLRLIDLKPEHLQHLYSIQLSKGLSAQTVRHHHTCLHKALQTAVEWGLLARNISDAVTPPRAQRIEMQIWNEDEISIFLQAARQTRYFTLFHTALFTGMRRSELLALRWCDLDLLLCQIYVSRSLHVLKGGKVTIRQPKSAKGRRMIALSPLTASVLRKYEKEQALERATLSNPLTSEDWVFSDAEGKPLLPNSVTHAWIKLVRRIGVKPIRLHDARHTHASLMLKQGTHPKVVQERLGHASIQITLDTYSHVAPGLQEAAAARFDQAFNAKYSEHEREAAATPT